MFNDIESCHALPFIAFTALRFGSTWKTVEASKFVLRREAGGGRRLF